MQGQTASYPANLFPPTIVGGNAGIVYVQPTPTTAAVKNERYLFRQSIGLGVAQLLLGCLCIVFNAISLALGDGNQDNYYTYISGMGFVGHGIWIGILFIIAGSFGIAAGVGKTKCKIVAYMVLCIIAAAFTAVLLSLGVLGAVFTSSRTYCRDYGYGYGYDYYYIPPCSIYTSIVALEGCMAVSAFIAAILFIWGSVLCCKSRPCCCAPQVSQQMQVYGNGMQGNAQVMHVMQHPLPTMPYQQGVIVAPPAYPAMCAPYWNQAPAIPPTAAAASDSASPVQNSTDDKPPRY